ncbi:MAG: NADH-quinone oxidoreductase subunit N [Methanonatronarchaeales archaeon]|nr:NADH-quinone oxidoreductase subunit N [Methanonatronarchaeales archaeon]
MELEPVLPHLLLLASGLGLLLVLPFSERLRGWGGEIALVLVVVSTAPLPLTFGVEREYFDGALLTDGFSAFFVLVFHLVAALVILGSLDFVEDRKNRSEYYSLILIATAGMDILASAAELLTIFVALEITTLSTYALVAFHKDEDRSVEAAIKFFLVGAFSSAILLMGISLLYGATGTTFLDGILEASAEASPGMMGLGALLLAAGFGFKVAAVPFHAWAPDTYEGAPTPISGYLASGSKAAGFAVILRVFYTSLSGVSEFWIAAFAVAAVLTMVMGNAAALSQRNFKRLMAYSGIAHTGYVMIVLVTLNELGKAAAMAHLLVYAFMNTGPFLFVALTGRAGVGERIDDFRGLYRRAPYMALSMVVFMFALTGLPPTGGFFTKLFIFLAAVEAGYWWLAVVGVVMSGVSLYYYMRVLKFMFVDEHPSPAPIEPPFALRYSVVICAVMTLVTFVAFDPIWDLVVAAASTL